MKSNIYYFSF